MLYCFRNKFCDDRDFKLKIRIPCESAITLKYLGENMKNGKFFKKDIPPACAYCKYGRAISGGSEVFCLKKGIMSAYERCRAYKYDVLKREPGVEAIAKDYDPADFIL